MRVLPIIIVGLVFASAAFLVQPVQAQPVSSLSGEVCMASPWNGEGCDQGLPGAIVRLTGGPAGLPVVDQSVTTGDWGRFVFDLVAQGDYTLAVSRTGFTAASQTISAPADEVVIILKPQTIVVEGTITDSKGAAVEGARVSFWGPEWASARTDAAGKYMAKLDAGHYSMEVDAGKSGYLQQEVFVDGSRLDVTLGALAGQDSRLKGKVTDQDGAPVAGADVIIDQWERRVGNEFQYGNYRNWTTTDAQGNYQVNVYAGSLSIRFTKADHSEVYQWTEVAAGKTATIDAELAKFPDKTARLVGKIVDGAGQAVTPVSISIQHPEYGLYSCSIDTRYGSDTPKAMPASEPYGGDAYYEDPYYYDPGCDITVHSDGTFTGNVTPGYAVISVWHDRYAACDEGHTSDGGYAGGCGPEYFSYTETRVLHANADNPMTFTLRERPGADATVSGYVIDGGAGKAVTQAFVSFNNQETYAWGGAETDGDGSYKMRVRGGYHHIQVWAEGYLPWQGVVHIPKGADMPFDVVLTAGESRYGGCCYAYSGDVMHTEAEPMAAGAPPQEKQSIDSRSVSQGGDYEDLRGGLGPYDEAKRNAQLHSDAGKQSPIPLAFAIVALGLVALRRRS